MLLLLSCVFLLLGSIVCMECKDAAYFCWCSVVCVCLCVCLSVCLLNTTMVSVLKRLKQSRCSLQRSLEWTHGTVYSVEALITFGGRGVFFGEGDFPVHKKTNNEVQVSDLQNISRQYYDYLTIMPKLRSTYHKRLIYKTYTERRAFIRYDSLAKS